VRRLFFFCEKSVNNNNENDQSEAAIGPILAPQSILKDCQGENIFSLGGWSINRGIDLIEDVMN
jgi:hypothetical protein